MPRPFEPIHPPIAVSDPPVEAAGFRFRTTRLPAGSRLPDHVHEQATLLVVLRGAYQETADGRSGWFPAMSVIAKPAGQHHSNDQGAHGALCLGIEVSDRRLAVLDRQGTVFDRRTVVREGPIGAAALRAARELAVPDDLTPLSLEGLALEMVAAAARDAATRFAPPRLGWLEELRELLDGVRSPPCLTTIARTVGRHPVYVARAFRKAFGCTIGAYVRRARIQRAQAVLTGSSESLAQIAARFGFCDQSHFSKAFRRETGMSPAQFRLRPGIRN